MNPDPEVITPQRRSNPENVAHIQESLGQIAATERERLRDVYEHGKARARDMEERFEGYVREHPLRSLLIATGVGAVLGILLTRRR